MQDPTWSDVADYIVAGLRRGDWPTARWLLLFLLIATLRLIVGTAWQRHREHQRLALIRSVVSRWNNGLGQPFFTLSTPGQLDAVARLREALVGNREIVFMLIVHMRLQMKSIPVPDDVLAAMDALATEWQDKLAPARRRRNRHARALEAMSRSVRTRAAGR